MNKLNGLVLTSLVLLGAAGCRGGKTEEVAVVNGDGITKDQLYEYMLRKPTVQVVTPNGPADAQVVQSIGLQALNYLIERQIILQMAKQQGLAPTSQDIQNEIDFQQKRNPNYLQTLTARQVPLDMIRRDIELDLARYRLLTRGITVTPQDIDDYIKKNPQQFRKPAEVQCMFIALKDPAKKKSVDGELSTGQNFQVVAQRYSEAPNVRQSGAELSEHNEDRLPPIVRDAIDKTPVDRPTDWVVLNSVNYKFYVEKKIGAEPVKIDDTVREEVKRAIAEDRGQKATDLQQRLNDELKKASIHIGEPALAGPWQMAIDSLKNNGNAPTQTRPGAGAATTGH